MDNLNEKYSNIIAFLKYISIGYCEDTGIEFHINILNEDKLNAGVKLIGHKEYSIAIFSGCLNLDYQIEKITKRYNADDLQTFFRFKKLGIFEKHEDDTYREELNNLFATVILSHIFWHEVGHIEAGYVDRKRDYMEFDSDEQGCYSKQEQEMVADWISTKQVFKLVYLSAIHGKVFDTSELVIAIKQLIMLYWVALTIEFQIFDFKHAEHIVHFSSLTHPYPAVRLLYSIEAMGESVVDILNSFGLDDDEAENTMYSIVNDIYIIIQSFLQITDTPIDVKKDEKRMLECYKILRGIPYVDDYEKNEFIYLEPLSPFSLEMMDKFLGMDINLKIE